MDKTVLCIFLGIIVVNPAAAIISLVDGVIKSYGNSTMISAFLCDKHEQANMGKYFARDYHRINILPVRESSLFHPVPPNHVVFVVNLQCPNVSQLLAKAYDMKLYGAPFKWLTYYDDVEDIDNIVDDYFENIDPLVDSDVMIASQIQSDIYVIKRIFKRQTNTSFIVEDMGEWSKTDGFIVDEVGEKISARRRRMLNGLTLKTSIVLTNSDSIHHLKDKRDNQIDSIAKVNYVLVEHLSNIVNASLQYSIQKTWGYKDNNSNWSGMVGELTRHEADIGGTALFMTLDRISIIDYIAMTTPTRSKFIFREPKLSYVTNVYTLPFDRYVWASILLLIFITALVLYVIVSWDWRKKKYVEAENQSNAIEIHSSWSEIVFITFGALCQQGASSVPFSASGRIAIFVSFLSLMFLYTSYSANIVALLQSSSDSIQSLEDILHSRLDVGVDDTVFNHFYFPNATEPIRKALYEQKVAPPGRVPKFYSIQEGVRRIRAGLFAFHVETGPGYKFISEIFEEGEKCGLKEIQYLQVSDPWLAIQKNSSFKKMLKVGLHLLQENGIQAREVGLIYPKKPQCLSPGSSFISVSMVDCYPALVVLVGGLFLSVLLLIIEIYIHYRLKYYKTMWSRTQHKRGNNRYIQKLPFIE